MTSLIIAGCATSTGTQTSSELSVNSSELNVIETCRKNLSIASPDTLRAAINLLAESDAGSSEAGIEYAYIAAQLMAHVYPVVLGELKIPTAPVGSIFPNLFKTIEQGNLPAISQKNTSFLTLLILPVAVLYSDSESIEEESLGYIDQAIQMNSKSVLPLYLRGIINERNGRYDEALSDFNSALELDPSCYPAEIGTARIYVRNGQVNAAVDLMDMLAAQYPYSVYILKTAAEMRYLLKDYTGALDYTSEVLRMSPDNPDILQLRARIFLDQQNYQQAARLVDVLNRAGNQAADFFLVKSAVEKASGDYLSALNTLERGRGLYPGNKKIEEAYGAVLMLAGRKDEAREILTGNGGAEKTGTEGLLVLIDDAIEMQDWNAASEYAQKLSAEDTSLKAGLAVWKVSYLQQKYEDALKVSEKLYSDFPDSSDAPIAYIKTLIELNRRLQAVRILDKRIPAEKDAEKRSELYYLKSLTDDSDDAKLQSLRSALFENLKNIDALVSISNLYINMGDIRKAYRYMKQAASLDPNNKEIMSRLAEIEGMVQ